MPVGARLTRSVDYARVQASGRRLRSAMLMLVVCAGGTSASRVGLTVSRKVGSAVVRNRVKRWLREAVRAVPGPRGGPWDLVLIPRPGSHELGFVAIRQEVGSLFGRVNK